MLLATYQRVDNRGISCDDNHKALRDYFGFEHSPVLCFPAETMRQCQVESMMTLLDTSNEFIIFESNDYRLLDFLKYVRYKAVYEDKYSAYLDDIVTDKPCDKNRVYVLDHIEPESVLFKTDILKSLIDKKPYLSTFDGRLINYPNILSKDKFIDEMAHTIIQSSASVACGAFSQFVQDSYSSSTGDYSSFSIDRWSKNICDESEYLCLRSAFELHFLLFTLYLSGIYDTTRNVYDMPIFLCNSFVDNRSLMTFILSMQRYSKELDLDFYESQYFRTYEQIDDLVLNFTNTFYANEFNLQRNDMCPCGSGKKYKKCHGRSL